MADQHQARNGAARSAVVVRVPPHLTPDHEWFIPGPGRDRRPLRVGEHVAPGHELVEAYPDCFVPSAEPPDTWPIKVLTIEALRRKTAEAQRLAPAYGRLVYPTCLRCHAQGNPKIVTDPPDQAALLNALSAVDEHDWPGRWKVEQEIAALARAAQTQQLELQQAEAKFHASHVHCPEGTPALPAPAVPSVPVPLRLRTGSLRSVE